MEHESPSSNEKFLRNVVNNYAHDNLLTHLNKGAVLQSMQNIQCILVHQGA